MTDKYTNAGVNVPPFYYTPISGTVNPSTGDSRNCICICELADGRILAVWHDGNVARGHVFSEIGAFLNDNVLASSAGTVIDSQPEYHYVSCFMVGSDVFINLCFYTGAAVKNQLYIANDPANPLAGWTLRYEFGSAGPSRLPGISGACAGIPTVIGSRWIMPTPVVAGFLGNGFYRMGVFISTSHGASFSNVVDEGFYIVGGSYMHMQGGQVIVMPDGRLMVPGWGSVTGVKRAFSSDDGASWSVDNPAGEGGMGPYVMQAILNNTADSFVAQGTHFYTINNSGLVSTDLGSFPGTDQHNFKAIWCPQAQVLVYSHDRNRISARAGGWLIDAIAL